MSILRVFYGRLTATIISVMVAFISHAADDENSMQRPHEVTVTPDGTVHIPEYAIPLSTFMSDEAKQAYIELRLNWPPDAQLSRDVAKARQVADRWLMPLLKKARATYAVTIKEQQIAGVKAQIVAPQQGIARSNEDRVLISLHGGGFFMGEGPAQLLDTIPIAAIGRIKVISINFRQGPEHKFPAASEDVATVYRALLKKHKSQDIGLYGSSTGGTLLAMSLAWFQQENLPIPGAIGLISAPILSGGDSFYSATPLYPLFGSRASAPLNRNPAYQPDYLADADINSPLVSPVRYPEILAKFPPTLIVTGTRDQLASGLIQTHRELVRVGVDSNLEIWEGMWHGFVADVDLPESKEAYEVIAKFFTTRLGRRSQ